jgi:hypothetical protein
MTTLGKEDEHWLETAPVEAAGAVVERSDEPAGALDLAFGRPSPS